MQEKVFYYHFDWLNGWFIFNAVLTIVTAYGCFACLCVFWYVQTYIIIAAVVLSDVLWLYKHVARLQAVLVNDDGIQIDHTQLLRWKDVAYAEEKDIRCCCRKCRIISLVPREGIDYKYNFLQKHNCFPPFSVPLYGILKREDEIDLQKIIADHVKYKKLAEVK